MTPTTKNRIRELADRLPPDATIEDAIERLVFLKKTDRGLAEANAGQLVDHDEVEHEFRRIGLLRIVTDSVTIDV